MSASGGNVWVDGLVDGATPYTSQLMIMETGGGRQRSSPLTESCGDGRYPRREHIRIVGRPRDLGAEPGLSPCLQRGDIAALVPDFDDPPQDAILDGFNVRTRIV